MRRDPTGRLAGLTLSRALHSVLLVLWLAWPGTAVEPQPGLAPATRPEAVMRPGVQADPAAVLARLEALPKSDAAAVIAFCEQALGQDAILASRAVALRLRAALAQARADQGDSAATREAAQRWVEAARRDGRREDQAAALIHLGWFHTRVAEFDAALACFVEALGSDGLASNPALRAAALHGIGRVQASRGEPEQAVRQLEEARRLFERAGDREGQAEVIAALGVTSGMQGDTRAAERHFREALAVFRSLGLDRKELVVLINLAVARDQGGDAPGALADLERALVLARRVGSPSDLALAHLNIGEILLQLGRPAEALPHFKEALRLSETQKARQMESWSHENLSKAYEQLGRLAPALEHARRFKTLHDTIYSEESDRRVRELEARYQAEARERDIKLLNSENALRAAELRRQRAVATALGIILLLTAGALAAVAVLYRTTRRQNRQLNERNAEIGRQARELEALRDDLEARVARRSEALNQANQALREEIRQRQEAEAERERVQALYLQGQKMEAVGLLAGGVAHDFNNILTGIGMSCELALQDVPPASPAARSFEEILELSRSATRLTRQLLAFSRKQVLRPTVVRLHDLVAQSVQMLGRIIGEDIAIRFVPGPDHDFVSVDTAQIEQVIVNLAVNARDAMPDGGTLTIGIRVETLPDAVEIGGVPLPAGRYVTLVIADQGVGIDAETLPHIFEPFFTTKPATRGTGLGLSTVYGIVRQHGGAIDVASEVGRGTQFTVWLPLAAAPCPTAPDMSAPVSAPARAAGAGKLLVLEDDDNIRALLDELLRREGYEVFLARTPREAQAILDVHGESLRLLISDVILPGINGPEFFARDVAPRLPHLNAVFMSGYSERHVLQVEVIDRGRLFLEKPFTREQLLATLDRALAATPPQTAPPRSGRD